MMGGYGMMLGFGMFIPLFFIGLVIYVALKLFNGSYSIRSK